MHAKKYLLIFIVVLLVIGLVAIVVSVFNHFALEKAQKEQAEAQTQASFHSLYAALDGQMCPVNFVLKIDGVAVLTDTLTFKGKADYDYNRYTNLVEGVYFTILPENFGLYDYIPVNFLKVKDAINSKLSKSGWNPFTVALVVTEWASWPADEYFITINDHIWNPDPTTVCLDITETVELVLQPTSGWTLENGAAVFTDGGGGSTASVNFPGTLMDWYRDQDVTGVISTWEQGNLATATSSSGSFSIKWGSPRASYLHDVLDALPMKKLYSSSDESGIMFGILLYQK